IFIILLAVGCFPQEGGAADSNWIPAASRLMTSWSTNVTPGNVHPEYPRPQLVRKEWVNLNGLWDYAIAGPGTNCPARFDGQVLVPFPIESALSGVGRRLASTNRIWYRRNFQVPKEWQ